MMKRMAYGLAAVFAAGSLWADTAVWTKTDSSAASWNWNASPWGLNWGLGSNWKSGSAPQTGDDVSFSKTPDEGVDKICTVVGQESNAYGNFSINTLSGLSSYEIILSLGSNLTVTDPSGFYGVFKVESNSDHSNQGYNHIQPNALKLNANADSSPVVINRYDDAFDSNIEVQNYGVEAQVLSVEHSGPGAIHKTGPGDLVAQFSQGAEHSVFVDSGALYVKENDYTDFSLGHATVSQGASLGVKPAETAIVSSVVAYGGTLNKVGAGDLRVGALSARDQEGQYDTGSANVVVQGGTFGTAAPAVVPSPSTFHTIPYLSLDASAENVFTFDTEDPTLVTTWNDSLTAGRFVTGAAAEGGGGTGRLPRFVANALDGKPVVDFGTFQYHIGEDNTPYVGDGTAGYFAFPEDHSIASFFMVFKKNSADRPAAFLGEHKDYSWVSQFRWWTGYSVDNLFAASGWNSGTYLGAVADWRIDGVRVDMEKYRLHSEDYHLISFAGGEAATLQAYLGANVTYGQFGGLSIAEVIIYDTPLAPGEREAIEAHLMDKWLGKKIPAASESVAVGTLTYPTAGDMVIETGKDLSVGTLDGTGKVVKKGAGRLSIAAQGGISGVDVQEGDLDFSIAAASGELSILDNAWFHMDPSVLTTLSTNDEGRVTNIVDVAGRAVSAGPSLVHEKSDWANHVAGPTIVEAPNTGLKLLDFGPYSYGAWNSQSCGMMISAEGEISSSDADVGKYNFRTALAVVEKISDMTNDKYAFLGGRAWSFTYSTQGKICDDAAPAIGGVGTWMLDGEVCNPATTDWRADGLHVIAFTLPSDTQVLINLLGQENDKDSADHMGGLRYGEVLIFRDTVSTADLRAMSLYLKEKWIGGSSEKDTSEGLHEVSVAAGSSCSISGDVTIADDSTVALGWSRSGSGTLTVNGTVTLGKRVEVSIPEGRGRVPLVKADAFDGTAALSTWRMNDVGFRYSIEGDTLYAECNSPGMIITIR